MKEKRERERKKKGKRNEKKYTAFHHLLTNFSNVYQTGVTKWFLQ